jgi:hypothetical protein
VIPDRNVAIQAVVSLAIDMLGFRNPIVVIGGARFVTIAVVEISGTVTIIRLRCFERLSSNEALEGKDGLLGLSEREETAVFLRKDLLKLLVIANAETSQVRIASTSAEARVCRSGNPSSAEHTVPRDARHR